MRLSRRLQVLVCCAALAASGRPARAAVNVAFGTSWDGPDYTLQKIVDGLYGPGHINVETDYIGAHDGEVDPWFWLGSQFSALLIREVAGNHNRNMVGWYVENGAHPAMLNDGIHDGAVFDGPASAGATRIVAFFTPMTRFGFYLDPNGPLDAPYAPQPECFFTNRQLNDAGPEGAGALHVPLGGDMQALVFDVSRYAGPNTWLVCFEDLDPGTNPGPCCATTDNDFNDFVFEVSAFGATPVATTTFGALKARYHH